MKRLNEKTLKVGDIILTTTAAAVSKAIRVATRSDISHAMVYVEDRSVIDATSEGVQARNTQRLLFEDDCKIYALRLRDGISTDQLRAVCMFVRSKIGTQYATKEAVRTVVGGAREWTRKQFCSRLVAQAFEAAGVRLVDNPNFCAPADLKSSPLLVEVENPAVLMPEQELAVWEGRADVPQMMRNAINAVFDGARRKSSDIQTFDDLHIYLATHPEDDGYFCELLESSGYLTVWQAEQWKNPWQYDLELMSRAPADEIESYCQSVLANEAAGPNRYVINLGGYRRFARQYGLRFFALLEALYRHLARSHRTRVDTAALWLENHRLLQPVPDIVLLPHSREWFAALDAWSPAQALTTREVIEATGSNECCSYCGAIPAKDYRLNMRFRPFGCVDTIRLCDDCVTQEQSFGEQYERMN